MPRHETDAELVLVVGKWQRLPEPVRKLVKSVVALQARCDGEDVADLGESTTPQVGGEYLSPAELLACKVAGCRLVMRVDWQAGQEVAILDRDGKRVKMGLDMPGG